MAFFCVFFGFVRDHLRLSSEAKESADRVRLLFMFFLCGSMEESGSFLTEVSSAGCPAPGDGVAVPDLSREQRSGTRPGKLAREAEFASDEAGSGPSARFRARFCGRGKSEA